jgi:GxxExxY protein
MSDFPVKADPVTTQTEENVRADLLSKDIIASAIDVHRELGPGLLESTYETCLCHELSLRKIIFERQRRLPISSIWLWKGLWSSNSSR